MVEPTFRPMTEADVEAVLTIEFSARRARKSPYAGLRKCASIKALNSPGETPGGRNGLSGAEMAAAITPSG